MSDPEGYRFLPHDRERCQCEGCKRNREQRRREYDEDVAIGQATAMAASARHLRALLADAAPDEEAR